MAIACAGNVRIEVYNSQIGVNDANSDGGGVYLSDGCEFELYDSGPFQGVLLNEAAGFGGGIFGRGRFGGATPRAAVTTAPRQW